MTRQEASQFTRDELNKNGLNKWSVRLNTNPNSHFLGLCSHKDTCIILSAHHIDIHPTPDVINTIKHEVAHALTPGHRHDDTWVAKAIEIGCDNTLPCSNLSLSPDIIDAIRSGADVEVTFTEQVIRTPRYNITRLQDKCKYCGKVAVTISEKTVVSSGDTTPDLKFIKLECGHMLIKRIPKGTPFHQFQFGGSLNCNHEWDKNTCVKCNRKRPYKFQLDGMAFGEAALAVNNGVAFFDEMGLGKTIEAEGLIYYHPEICTPTLWMVKSGLKYQLAVSLLNWMGDSHVPQVINTSKDWLIPNLKHYIIGYDMLVQKSRTLKNGTVANQGFDITQFDRVGIKCVVLDECQQIKNVDSSRTQMVRRVVKGRKVIALSGTPWNNRGSELFPVLNMLDPMKFNSEDKFKRQWVDTYWDGKYMKEGGIRRIPAFKEYTKDIIIRRERTEVMAELPLVNRTKLYVKMDPTQESIYDEAVQEFVDWYNTQSQDIGGMHILAAMAKMRHLVALAKIPATVDYVDEFVEDTDRKIVVFAHHKEAQYLLFSELHTRFNSPEITVLKLTSEMNAKERFDVQTEFNSSKRSILVASTQAAGEGLNLQTCADCVMHERQWNPGKEEQAEGRFIRIGQTATSVNATYTHMEGLTAIDGSLDSIVERKRVQFHEVMNKGEAPRWNEDAIIKELAESIVNAHNAKKNRKVLQGAK
jgi:SWI/SNF-related matrix-associated actin-dependent regulator of chromatin subfamily A-like protein 1